MRDLFTKDLGWKIFSFVLALIIWIVVRPTQDEPAAPVNPLAAWETRSFTNLAVDVVSAAADVREFKVNPDTVHVIVRGRPEVIRELEEKDIEVIVNLKDIQAARGLRKRVKVSVPPSVTLVQVVPDQVDIVIPPKKEK